MGQWKSKSGRQLALPGGWAALMMVVLASLFAPQVIAKSESTADHSKFKELQQPFASGPEVTKACLSCHTEAADQIHRTKHWKWEFTSPETGQKLGKKNVINNFCISTPANYTGCASCHVGYGWKDNNFDFTSKENVDCLVCHDTTGSYKKAGGAGHPVYKDIESPPGSGKILKAVNLRNVAQSVGKTSRDTCGACHFFGGGGDGVKHGDMDSSLAAPDRDLDVHMDALGLDFTCGTCHEASSHDVIGSRYTPTAKGAKHPPVRGMVNNSEVLTCNSCHGAEPHKGSKTAAKLNDHTNVVACQTCHIPEFARGGVATKMVWDWSTAGKRDEHGKQFVKKDAKGNIVYESRKGDFVVAENVVPEYRWFNGSMSYTLMGDRVDAADGILQINKIGGSASDGKSLIWPMKISRGKQPYDTVNKTLVTPHLVGDNPTGYWKNLSWDNAIRVGMQASGGNYSGKMDFIETEMFWPITHMVAPKEQSLGCIDCHAKNARLEEVKGVFIPGRDRNSLVDLFGWLAVIGSAGGVAAHGTIRALSRRRDSGKKG